MEFFSNAISSTLQYYTFPLELVGLTLAAIEVRYPHVLKTRSGHRTRDEDSTQYGQTELPFDDRIEF